MDSNNHKLLLQYAAEMLAMRQTSAQDFNNRLPALVQEFQDSASARLAELQATSAKQSPLLEQLRTAIDQLSGYLNVPDSEE